LSRISSIFGDEIEVKNHSRASASIFKVESGRLRSDPSASVVVSMANLMSPMRSATLVSSAFDCFSMSILIL